MKEQRIRLYVAAYVVAALISMALAWRFFSVVPGPWEIAALLLVGFLLEIASTTLRSGEGKGSISFVSDLAAGLLFGPFWAGLVAALSMGLSQIWTRRPPIRLVFKERRALTRLFRFLTPRSLVTLGQLPAATPKWWRRRDSNPRPPGCKPGALPTELRPQVDRGPSMAVATCGGGPDWI